MTAYTRFRWVWLSAGVLTLSICVVGSWMRGSNTRAGTRVATLFETTSRARVAQASERVTALTSPEGIGSDGLDRPESALEESALASVASRDEAGAAGMGAAADALAREADPAEVAALWRDQPLDAIWSEEVTTYLEASLDDLSTQGEVLDVSCRQTLCRAVMRFKDADAANGYAEVAAEPEVQKWIRFDGDERGLVLEVLFGR